MKKLIYTTILITLFSCLSSSQETTIWLNGSKTKKAQIESKSLKVFVNDAAEREKRHSVKTVSSGDEKFDRIFREARELMDKEDWAKAAAKFSEIACDCPENKQVDAALYWLAYSYKKLKMAKETNAAIERLLKNHPNSSWADDAQVLRYQISTPRSVNGTTSVGQGNSQANVYYPGFETFPAQSITGTTNISQDTQIDREDEIRLAAFQSLFAADPKKGIEAVGNILGANSKASETLKREVLRTLRGSRYGLLINHSGGYWASAETSQSEIVKQLNPLLRDALIKGFQTESNLKIRAEIIYSIANINDEASYNFLAQTYPNESNKDFKKAIINAFGGGNYTFVSGQAYAPSALALADRYNAANLLAASNERLSAISGQSGTTKPSITNPVRELRFIKLMEIFRSERDLELRRLALGNIQRFTGWSTRDGMIDSLAQMYDAETDEQFKISIIHSFSNLPKNQQATNKLLNVAKNDKSDKMRLEAIRALRNNNSPEVIQFLESLIN